MNIKEIISKKQLNEEPLTKEEINFFVKGFLIKDISDEDMTLLLKAIFSNGMTVEETVNYTQELIDSGEMLPLREDWVDKHSSGGVGDKISIILLPILAAMDLKIMKISGRSLGFTGGTVDKLESIPNFNIGLTIEEAIRQVEEIGLALTGQTPNLTPADKVIYALRDITNTVASVPLIAASIMSKKIASGAKNILIDLKVGTGAFVKTIEEARVLGSLMKKIGEALDRNVFILFSSMNAPLGSYIGNASEVFESYKFLKGENQNNNIRALVKKISSELYSKSKNVSFAEAKKVFEDTLNSGRALEKFNQWLKAQGTSVKNISNVFKPVISTTINAPLTGCVTYTNVSNIGLDLLDIGVGRKIKNEPLNYQAGMQIHVTPGQFIEKGQELFTIFSSNILSKKYIDKLLLNFNFEDTPTNEQTILGELPWL